jgi:urea transport system permease protein
MIPGPSRVLMARLAAGLVLAVALASSGAAAAASLADDVRDLGSTDPDRVRHALGAIAERGDAAALPAVEALLDDRLRTGPDGAVYIQDLKRDALVQPLSLQPVSPSPRPLRTIETDNELRRQASPVAARLRLSAADPALRLAAAEELSSDEEMLPIIRAALAKETNRGVRDALSLAVARHDLQSSNADERLAAVESLRQLGKTSVKGELQSLLRGEKDDRVRRASQAALSAIGRHEALVSAVGSVLYGFSLASVFLFAALGLAITFGVMGVINMAHGEMLTIGAYATFMTQVFFQKHLPGLLPYYLFAAIPFAFVLATAVGVLLERSVIRHLYGRPLETLLATWGISLVIIQVIRLMFGAANVAVANPGWLAGGTEVISGITVPYNRIGVIVFVILAATFVWYLLQRTSLGLQVRAVTQNRNMAACMGVSTKRIDMWTFGLGSGIAGLGGVALSQIGNVGPELGQSYIIDSFMVVVLGGVGRIAGTIGAALGLGIVQKFLEPISGAVLGKIAVLVVIILFIQRRPQGIFPVKGRIEA